MVVVFYMANVIGADPYVGMEDLLEIDSCRPSCPIRLPQGMEVVISPLNWRVWERALARHPDNRFRKYIVEGIRNGFRVGFDYWVGVRVSLTNMASAREHPEVVDEYLAEECSSGRVLGPLNPEEWPFIHTSRFGVIPKGKPKEGRRRLIVDL